MVCGGRPSTQDPSILGKPISLKGEPYMVVGVLPRGAQMPNPADVWTPLMPDDPHGVCVGNNCLILMRLKPGVTWDQVRAQLAHMPPPRNTDLSKAKVWYFPSLLHAYAGNAMREQTQALMAAVSFILLIACANLAGLTLARIHRRVPEMATRMALGASRGRILRQLWVENLVLALAGGACGVGLALALFPVIKQLLPDEMIPIGGFAPEWLGAGLCARNFSRHQPAVWRSAGARNTPRGPAQFDCVGHALRGRRIGSRPAMADRRGGRTDRRAAGRCGAAGADRRPSGVAAAWI